jgi:S-ribosylhomocysteine lyase LuxS involved in autoinducer biosynthesis
MHVAQIETWLSDFFFRNEIDLNYYVFFLSQFGKRTHMYLQSLLESQTSSNLIKKMAACIDFKNSYLQIQISWDI